MCRRRSPRPTAPVTSTPTASSASSSRLRSRNGRVKRSGPQSMACNRQSLISARSYSSSTAMRDEVSARPERPACRRWRRASRSSSISHSSLAGPVRCAPAASSSIARDTPSSSLYMDMGIVGSLSFIASPLPRRPMRRIGGTTTTLGAQPQDQQGPRSHGVVPTGHLHETGTLAGAATWGEFTPGRGASGQKQET